MSKARDDRPLTGHLKPDRTPLSVDEYERAGGYQGLRKALKMAPKDVQKAVSDSRLRGRGGAGFPTGKKWSFVPMGDRAPTPKYVAVNADEMEPGTMKDRLLMEGNPHLLIEGAAIAAHAVGAEVAYIFLRWAYKKSARALETALSEARERGYLGGDILGSGFHLDMHVHVSAGRYMCGEETGLLNALEGRRATPRHKPPYPQVCGLWGKPTVVNNVETLSCVGPILDRGPEWFAGLSLTENGGTKLYGVSGRVNNPGLWELPLGTPAGQIISDHAGGMRDGLTLRAIVPGGGSTGFLMPGQLDTPMDFGALEPLGSRMGTGTITVLDDGTCPVAMLLSLERFFARESCGWCTPCREGLPWIVEMLEAIENGEGTGDDIDRLEEMASLLAPGHTFCALAPGAADPLATGLKYFRDDFRRHLDGKGCPWR